MRRVFRLRSARRQAHGWPPVGRPSQLSLPVVLAVALILLQTGTPESVADPCPDVEVMFARGTFEPAGVGATGETFIDSLRAKVGTKSLGVYPVDYPASLDFARAADGVIDASHRVEDLARPLSQNQSDSRRLFPGRSVDRLYHDRHGACGIFHAGRHHGAHAR